MKKIIDVYESRAIFNYNALTGILTNKFTRGPAKRDEEAGTIEESGVKNSIKLYRRVLMNGKFAYVHRVIWVMMTGEQPDEVDHIDGNGLNNKWDNLRNITHKQNGKNQKIHTTNTSGTSGVTFRRDTGRWRARLIVDGIMIDSGSFKNKEDAIRARKQLEKEHGYEFDYVEEAGRYGIANQ